MRYFSSSQPELILSKHSKKTVKCYQWFIYMNLFISCPPLTYMILIQESLCPELMHLKIYSEPFFHWNKLPSRALKGIFKICAVHNEIKFHMFHPALTFDRFMVKGWSALCGGAGLCCEVMVCNVDPKKSHSLQWRLLEILLNKQKQFANDFHLTHQFLVLVKLNPALKQTGLKYLKFISQY